MQKRKKRKEKERVFVTYHLRNVLVSVIGYGAVLRREIFRNRQRKEVFEPSKYVYNLKKNPVLLLRIRYIDNMELNIMSKSGKFVGDALYNSWK
jgi:hypothetical protein